MNAQAAPQFASILDRAPTEVERPKPLPVGTYVTLIVGQPRYDKSSKKQTDFVEFTHKFLAAGDDVDQDALNEALTSADGTKKNLGDVTRKNTYYLTENAVWRLDEFHEHCGIEMSDDVSRRERNEQTPGRQVGVVIRHEASQDGTAVYDRIDKTVAVE